MNKKKIIIGVISIVALILVLVVLRTLYILNIIPHKTYTDLDFNIQTYHSLVDKDNDGINDQQDILMSARNYIAAKPKYKSKYYGTGYPNDEYGVCVDVVAQALKNSGYDLMMLVYEDVLKNRNDYDIDVVDKNIDFRRVKNLKVYFKNTAIELTTDIYKIEEWQAGDIVIFEKHIGIISDKRNKKGIPFVIHHNKISELHNYEEDILEYRDDIVGHYRIS